MWLAGYYFNETGVWILLLAMLEFLSLGIPLVKKIVCSNSRLRKDKKIPLGFQGDEGQEGQGNIELKNQLAELLGASDWRHVEGLSATDAAELYERERGAGLDAMARLSNLALLIGVCGTLAGIMWAIPVGEGVPSIPKELPWAFSITLVGVGLAAVGTLAQHLLAGGVEEVARNLLRSWASLKGRPEETKPPTTVGEPTPLPPGPEGFNLDELARQVGQLTTATGKFTTATGKLSTAAERASHSFEALGSDSDAWRKAYVDELKLLSKHWAEVARQTGRGVETASENYRTQLQAISEATLQSLSKVVGETGTNMETLRDQLTGLDKEVGTFLKSALNEVGAKFASQVSEQLERIQQGHLDFIENLGEIKTIAPEVGQVLDDLRPSAVSIGAAILSVGGSVERTTKAIEEASSKSFLSIQEATAKATEGTVEIVRQAHQGQLHANEAMARAQGDATTRIAALGDTIVGLDKRIEQAGTAVAALQARLEETAQGTAQMVVGMNEAVTSFDAGLQKISQKFGEAMSPPARLPNGPTQSEVLLGKIERLGKWRLAAVLPLTVTSAALIALVGLAAIGWF